MACHTPPLKKPKKQGEMTLPSLGSILSLNSTFSSHSSTTVVFAINAMAPQFGFAEFYFSGKT